MLSVVDFLGRRLWLWVVTHAEDAEFSAEGVGFQFVDL